MFNQTDSTIGNSGSDNQAGAVSDSARAGAGNMADAGFNNSYADALAYSSSTPNELGFGSFGLTQNGQDYTNPQTGKCAT